MSLRLSIVTLLVTAREAPKDYRNRVNSVRAGAMREADKLLTEASSLTTAGPPIVFLTRPVTMWVTTRHDKEFNA